MRIHNNPLSRKRPVQPEESHAEAPCPFLAANSRGISVPVPAYPVAFDKNGSVQYYPNSNYPLYVVPNGGANNGHPVAVPVAEAPLQGAQRAPLIQTVSEASSSHRPPMPFFALPSLVVHQQQLKQAESGNYWYAAQAILRVASSEGLGPNPRFVPHERFSPRSSSLTSIGPASNGAFGSSAESSVFHLLSTLPEDSHFTRRVLPSFSNISELFYQHSPGSTVLSLPKLNSTQSFSSLSSLNSLSQFQRMTPLKPVLSNSASSNAAITVPHQMSLSQSNLEFLQAHKKSRPNSPTQPPVNLHKTSSSSASPAQVVQAKSAAHPFFIISPHETPLQTPSHSPHLSAQVVSDRGINSISLFSKLENEQKLYEQKDESIAINGITLPPIRTAFNFSQPEVKRLTQLHVKKECKFDL